MTEEVVGSSTLTETGLLYVGRGRLRAVDIQSGGTAGLVTFRNGGPFGEIILSINTPAGTSNLYHAIPGKGIPFAEGLHVTMTNQNGVTAYFGEDRAP